MNVIHNQDTDMVAEMIDGYVAANPGMLERIKGSKSICVRQNSDKVKILIGGGAGCEPLYIGYAGIGMADAAVSGNIFAAPPATAILKTIRHLDHEKGVLMVTGNYIGDVLNYELAAELCGYEGILAKPVFVKDDILHFPKEKAADRRGITGIIPVIKIAAGAAAGGLELAAVQRIAEKAAAAVGTVSVTFWPGYRPETGMPMYQMEEGCIEFGMGFNGEPGVLRMAMPNGNELARLILDYLITDMELDSGQQIALIVNGKGATSNMELYLLVQNLHRYLAQREIAVFRTETGNFFTAPGMGGVSVTVVKLDEELKEYYHREAYTPMYSYHCSR